MIALTDVFTKEKRSWIMSRIRGKNTKIEKLFEHKLRINKIKFKGHPKILKKGNPDFLIDKIAVFIDGCFWHKCPLHYRIPKSKKKYWLPKIEENVKRDKEVNKSLKKMGYKVVRFWEHEINKNPDKCIRKVKGILINLAEEVSKCAYRSYRNPKTKECRRTARQSKMA